MTRGQRFGLAGVMAAAVLAGAGGVVGLSRQDAPAAPAAPFAAAGLQGPAAAPAARVREQEGRADRDGHGEWEDD